MSRTNRMRMLLLAAGRGERLRGESGGRPKQLLEVGGATLFEHALALARCLRADPLVVTRPEFAGDFTAAAASAASAPEPSSDSPSTLSNPSTPSTPSKIEVLVEEHPVDILGTLYHARHRVTGTFCWLAGDLLFGDLEPLCRLASEHAARGSYASFLYCRSDRFKAKLDLGPPPRVVSTRAPGWDCSIVNFAVHSAAAFDDLAREPRDGYVQRALDRGEPIVFREYAAPVFEIDTPADLAAARRHFAAAGGAP
jgi:NDP-sugar pyrophosphorylase family protein